MAFTFFLRSSGPPAVFSTLACVLQLLWRETLSSLTKVTRSMGFHVALNLMWTQRREVREIKKARGGKQNVKVETKFVTEGARVMEN